MITKSYIGISKEEFYSLFLQLINVLQTDTNKLTKMQRQLFIEFLLLDDQVYKFTRFSSHGKKAVAESMKIKYGKDVARRNLDIFVIALTKKGFIYKDADKVKYINKGLKMYIDQALNSDNPLDFVFRLKISNNVSGS